jgi:hypothetical protein
MSEQEREMLQKQKLQYKLTAKRLGMTVAEMQEKINNKQPLVTLTRKQVEAMTPLQAWNFGKMFGFDKGIEKFIKLNSTNSTK